MTNDAETLFRLTQDKIREAVAELYDTKPSPFWGTSRGQKSLYVALLTPMGWFMPIYISEQLDGGFHVYVNDEDLHDITTFKPDRPMEAEAVELYCRLPIRITDTGLGMRCTRDQLQPLAPLFVLVIQKIYAAQKLRDLERFND